MATVNIITNSGYDLSTLYADMAGSDPASGTQSSTNFTSPNAGAGIVFNIIGSGFTYNVSPPDFDILTGTVTAIEIRNLSDNTLLVELTGISMSGPDFGSAVGDYPDETALDALFKTISYNFTGANGADVMEGGDLSDLFDGGAGNDTFDGGAAIDRATYANATGAISVNMAAGTVTGDASVGSDTLSSVESIRGSGFADTFVATGWAGSSVAGSTPPTFNEFEGMAGNDSITGNGGTIVSYWNATAAVTADIQAGTGTGDASVGSDTFTGVSGLRGSAFNDSLAGSNNPSGVVEIFQGGAGDDTIDGRGGFDRAVYAFALDDAATGAINVSLAAGTVTGDASVGTDTLLSVEAIRGTSFDDTFDATGFTASSTNAGTAGTNGSGAAFNEFEGRGGNDTITGNGNTRISYVNASAGVAVDIAAGTATGNASVGTDTFSGVFSVIGSQFGDTLSGSNNAANTSQVFEGKGGNDAIDGLGGFDQAVYFNDPNTTSGISVDMAAGTVTGDSSIGTDTLTAIESVRGTNFADTYVSTGFAGASTDTGLPATFNEFEGMGGNDVITGNGSNTRISYTSATSGVTVDIAAGTATGDSSVGADTFTGVSRVRGSNNNDTIRGGSGNNILEGQNGNDILDGRTGNDTLTGGGNADTYIYSIGYGADVITDFNRAQGDKIDLTGFSSVDSLADVQAIASGTTTTVINFGGGDTLTLNGIAPGTLVSSDFIFAIVGDNNDNTINGTSGNDVIYGLGGNDTLDGGAGSDKLYGGDGDDHLYTDGGDSVLDGGADTDTLHATGNLTGTTISSVENLVVNINTEVTTITAAQLNSFTTVTVVTGGNDWGNITLATAGSVGGNFAAGSGGRFIGSAGADTIDMSATNGVWRLWAGDDLGGNVLTGGSANDFLTAGNGGDTLNGSDGADVLSGGSGNDTLNGGNDGDALTGGGGTDVLNGGSGNDSLNGEAGSDALYGDAGNDTLFTDGSDSVLDGGADTDTLQATGNLTGTTISSVENLVVNINTEVTTITAAQLNAFSTVRTATTSSTAAPATTR